MNWRKGDLIAGWVMAGTALGLMVAAFIVGYEVGRQRTLYRSECAELQSPMTPEELKAIGEMLVKSRDCKPCYEAIGHRWDSLKSEQFDGEKPR